MNGQSIEISVIIPVYQAEAFLEDCFKTVKKAAEVFEGRHGSIGKVVQIILVDDGSKDKSGEICDRLKADNILVKHTENFGVSHARNIGMEMASGKYISFVDSDDKVMEDYFLNLYNSVEGSEIIIGDMMETLPADKVLGGQDYIRDAILYGDTHVWGKLFLLSYIKKQKLLFREDLTIGEDMLFLMELALSFKGKDFAKKASPNGYIYTDNEQGAMKRSYSEKYLDQIKCWNYAQKLMEGSEWVFERKTYDRLSEIQIMSAMLVAGKIACIDDRTMGKADKDLINAALNSCSDSINKAKNLGKGFERLSTGYKLKVVLFTINKNMYLKIYGKWKRH